LTVKYPQTSLVWSQRESIAAGAKWHRHAAEMRSPRMVLSMVRVGRPGRSRAAAGGGDQPFRLSHSIHQFLALRSPKPARRKASAMAPPEESALPLWALV